MPKECARTVSRKIEKLFVLVVIIVASYSALPITSFAQSSVSLETKRQANKPPCANLRFHHLRRYKDEWSRVFRDKEVAPVLRRLLKNDYRKLIDSLKSVSYPEDPEDSLSFVDRRGVLTLRGFVPGLGTIMEAMLVVEPCGNIYVAVLDSERFLYFSNDKEYIDRLPPVIEQWRTGIEQSRSGFERRPQLPVMFKSK